VARVVAAFASSHAPMMLNAQDSAPADQRERFLGALGAAARRVRDRGAQAVIVVSNEHFTNFFLDNFPQHCVGVAATHEGPAERWLRMPRGRFPGHAGLARSITRSLLDARLEPAFSHRLRLDHGVMTLYHAVDPQHRLPLVPILQNCAVSPMPTLAGCHQFGAALAGAIAACDAVQRVAVVAGGGLSHWVGTERVGEIDAEFDRWFLDRVAKNSFDDVLDLTEEELEHAGNGAHEIRSWLLLAGLADRPATVLAYEPIQPWITGMAVAEYDMDRGPA
jgi:aromatic ring-opening dioxygenase catalytic subunit (LigB family)